MAGKKDKSDGRQLTELQRRFALQVLEGKSPSLVHAYREVYDCKGDSPKQKKAQANEASRLWKHPGVRSFSEDFRKKAEAQRVRREVGERERVRQRLWNEADAADRASDRLTALRLLGQDAGMFTERVEVKEATDELTDAEVIAEIEMALRNAIDVSASSLVEDDKTKQVEVRVSSSDDDEPDGYLM
tara:strand:- start:2684 stop:3244 length:561 start_codon:yes stop_codon:yes gene_type:complete